MRLDDNLIHRLIVVCALAGILIGAGVLLAIYLL
jgi:hypothetical protein